MALKQIMSLFISPRLYPMTPNLIAEVIVELTWMIAHFDFAREQTGLNDEPSPELKRAKKLLEKLETLSPPPAEQGEQDNA